MLAGTNHPDVAAPFTAALLAHHRESWPQLIAMHGREQGMITWITTDSWFCEFDPRHALFLSVIENIKGPVLDIGAGAGRAALALQRLGVSVLALDCEATCVQIMRERGVQQTVCSDIFNFESEQKFNTILLLDSTIGLTGDISRLGELLTKIKKLLNPGGVVLVQDVSLGAVAYKFDARFEFRGQSGPPFSWVNYGYLALSKLCASQGWRAKCVGIHKGQSTRCNNSYPEFFMAQLKPAARGSLNRWLRQLVGLSEP